MLLCEIFFFYFYNNSINEQKIFFFFISCLEYKKVQWSKFLYKHWFESNVSSIDFI